MELSEYWHLSHYIGSFFSAKIQAFQRKGSDGPNTGPAEVFEASVEAVEASVEGNEASVQVVEVSVDVIKVSVEVV